MAIPHGRLRFMWDLQRQENFRASIPMSYLLLRSIRSRNFAQVWKSEAASKMTPEVSAPAKETPADELPQPDNANAEVIPDAAQMEHILEAAQSDLVCFSLWQKMLAFLQIVPVS